jgi:hypothetical protein
MMVIRNNRSIKWKPEDKHGYVITGQELEAFAVSLRVGRAHRIAYLLRGVANMLDGFAGQDIGETHMQLIRQVAKEENHRQYKKLMTKIIDALKKGGERGRRASRLTITRYLEILFDEPMSFTGSMVIRRSEKTLKDGSDE